MIEPKINVKIKYKRNKQDKNFWISVCFVGLSLIWLCFYNSVYLTSFALNCFQAIFNELVLLFFIFIFFEMITFSYDSFVCL